MDLSGTNPSIPAPRQSQFGFKGNHGRNWACRKQHKTLEARRLQRWHCVCVCVFLTAVQPFQTASPLSAPTCRSTSCCAHQKGPFPRCWVPTATLCVTRSSYKRRRIFLCLVFLDFLHLQHYLNSLWSFSSTGAQSNRDSSPRAHW